jgi:hypothetical protein
VPKLKAGTFNPERPNWRYSMRLILMWRGRGVCEL